MTSKLEQIASVITERMSQFPCTDLDCARAAVEALREPLEAAIEPGALAGEMYGNTDAKATWQAMIDAILYEPQTSSKPLPSSDPIITTVRYSTRTVENVTPPWPPSQGPEMTQQQVEAMERGRT